MKTRGKKTVQIVSTADIASAPSTNQSQIVTYPNAGPSTQMFAISQSLNVFVLNLVLNLWENELTWIPYINAFYRIACLNIYC